MPVPVSLWRRCECTLIVTVFGHILHLHGSLYSFPTRVEGKMDSTTHPPQLPPTELSMSIIKDSKIGLGVVMHTRSFTTADGDEQKYLVVKKVRDIIVPDGDTTVTLQFDAVIPSTWDAKGKLLHLPYAPGVIVPGNLRPGDKITAGTALPQVS